MFDITFAELLVVVTGAGLLLGKQEIALASKLVGKGIGRVIGTLQGMKIKYDTKTKGTRIQTLHREVRLGMNEVATIGHDLSSLAYSNRQYGNTYNNASNIPSSISSPASISSSVTKSSLIQQQSSSSSLTLNHDINVNRIAHLILVDQKLNNTSSHSNDGVDIIVSTISESILADSYAMKMNDNNLNTNSNTK